MISFFLTMLMCIANSYHCLENLSRRKTTNLLQSSTYKGGAAALASDGNLDFKELNCSRTNINQTHAWLQVDLGKPYSINNVRIYRANVNKSNSTKQYGLGRFYLDVSKFLGTLSTTKERTRCYTDNTAYPDLPSNIIDIPCKHTARYVTVETTYDAPEDDPISGTGLGICVIEVYGCEVGKYGDDCRLCPGCQTCDVSSGLCKQDSSYPVIQLTLYLGLAFLFMLCVLFCRRIRGKQCLYKRKYTPKHGTSNPGHGNEVTSTCLTHANNDENICYKFDHKHSTTLDIQTELQTCSRFLLRKGYSTQPELTQPETGSQTSISGSNSVHVSYDNVQEVGCIANNSNLQETVVVKVNLQTCKQCHCKRGFTSKSEMTSRLSTNEAHSDGKLYDNLNKEVPVSSDYDQLRVTDTILDSKISKQSECYEEYTTRPAKESCLCNNENVSHNDFYSDVPLFDYENLLGDDCIEKMEGPEQESLYDLP